MPAFLFCILARLSLLNYASMMLTVSLANSTLFQAKEMFTLVDGLCSDDCDANTDPFGQWIN